MYNLDSYVFSKYLFIRTFLFIVVSCGMLLVSGCATMDSSKSELQGFGNNEGLILGSFEVNAAKTGDEVLLFGKIPVGGTKTSELKYTVIFEKEVFENRKLASFLWGDNPFALDYELQLKPGDPQLFVKKLPEGKYRIREIRAGGLYWQLDLPFVVTAKESSYIGRTTILLPHRAMRGLAGLHVSDHEREDLGVFQAKYEIELQNYQKKLIVISE